jgi:hypothetical protein
MIELDKRLPRQMNGPVINSFMQALGENLTPADEINSHLKGLSIATAQEQELESIGKIIGYPRPLMPAGLIDENTFVLGTIPLAVDYLKGLSSVNTMLGGELSGVNELVSVYMALPTYRRALVIMARIKAYGLTLENIDKIASLVNEDYDLSWTDEGDVTIHYTENIGFSRVWVLSRLFYRIATAPQVLVTSG